MYISQQMRFQPGMRLHQPGNEALYLCIYKPIGMRFQPGMRLHQPGNEALRIRMGMRLQPGMMFHQPENEVLSAWE